MGEMFGQELRRLRKAAGLSPERLSRLTVSAGDEGLSSKTIEALEKKLERVPDDRTVILLGRALATRDQVLAGLELAEARRLLDERQVGYEEASANLARMKGGQGRTLGRLGNLSGGDDSGAARLRLGGRKPPATDPAEDRAETGDR